MTNQNYQNWLDLWDDAGLAPRFERRKELDRLLEDFWSPFQVSRDAQREKPLTPACDLSEDKDHYLLSVEMPGISKRDVKLEIDDNQLKVSGERLPEKRTQESGAWYSERRVGRYQRTFKIPPGTQPDQIEAHHEDGVLRIYIPKVETAKPRQIRIESGPGPVRLGQLTNQPTTRASPGQKASDPDVTTQIAS